MFQYLAIFTLLILQDSPRLYNSYAGDKKTETSGMVVQSLIIKPDHTYIFHLTYSVNDKRKDRSYTGKWKQEDSKLILEFDKGPYTLTDVKAEYTIHDYTLRPLSPSVLPGTELLALGAVGPGKD